LNIIEMKGHLVLARSRGDQFFTEKDYPEVLKLLSEMLTAIAASTGHASSARP
jgi:hypothetical protein